MITIKNERFAKMYWELLPYCNDCFNAFILLCYMIDAYPITKHKIMIDNEEYAEFTASFIQEKIDWERHTIKKYIDKLVECNLIKLVKAKNNKNQDTYRIHLMVNVDNGNEYGTEYGNDHGNGYGNDHGKNFTIKQTNRQTNQQTNRVSKNKDLNKEFGDPNVPLLEDVIKYIREIGCTWLTDLEIEDFYNTVVSRGWKKAKGEPILEWHAYFKWFAEKDKPNYVGDQDLSEKNKDSIEGWLK